MPGQGQQTQSAPAVTPAAPTSNSDQSTGPGNASEVDEAGLGAPASELGIDALRQAVDDGDGDEAWNLVQGLPTGDIAELNGDNTLAERTMALVGPEHAASVLYMVQYPLDIYLQYADIHCASSTGALSTVLSDVGICDASDIVTHLTELSGLAAFANAAILDPLILASPAEDQAVLISSAEGVSFYSSFHDESPLLVLEGLAAESDPALDLFLLCEPARELFMCDVETLNDFILVTWCTVGDWYCELGLELFNDLDLLILTDMEAWVAALIEELGPRDMFLLPLPATPLTTLILCAIGDQSPDDLVLVCRAIGYDPADAMRFFFEQGWLTLETAQALLVDSTAEQQAAVSGDPDIVATLMPLAYIEDVLPLLTAGAGLPVIYTFMPHIQPWLEMDMARFEIIARAQPDPWTSAFVTTGRLQLLLDFAVADPAGWRVLVSDAKLQAVLGALQKPCAEAEVPGLWALWTDANRSVDTGYALFYTLFGVRLWTSGDQPTFPESDLTTGGITYERRVRFDTIQPDQATLNTYLARLALLPRGLVSAAGVGFGNRMMMDVKEKAPAPDADWGDTVGPLVLETYTTSVTFSARNF
ncbi:MAG: hypothetical protein JRJ84_23765, partial [Deltaproteobacteria bacterium]|nr:hypothetical protein [Deltaproteobacteria bacterium]